MRSRFITGVVKLGLFACAAAAALSAEGCCCAVVTVTRFENGRCFQDSYNCRVHPLAHLQTVEVPCGMHIACTSIACPEDGGCASVPSCAAAIDCDAGQLLTGPAFCDDGRCAVSLTTSCGRDEADAGTDGG